MGKPGGASAHTGPVVFDGIANAGAVMTPTRLRIALGSLLKSTDPLTAANYAYESREPQNLAGLERLLLEHLADVEDALAEVRRLRLRNEGYTPWCGQ